MPPPGPVLDDLAGAADDDPPRKSRPSKLSPGLVDFGGAAGALGMASRLEGMGGSTVFGRAGAAAAGASISSPNKSTCCGRALGA